MSFALLLYERGERNHTWILCTLAEASELSGKCEITILLFCFSFVKRQKMCSKQSSQKAGRGAMNLLCSVESGDEDDAKPLSVIRARVLGGT